MGLFDRFGLFRRRPPKRPSRAFSSQTISSRRAPDAPGKVTVYGASGGGLRVLTDDEVAARPAPVPGARGYSANFQPPPSAGADESPEASGDDAVESGESGVDASGEEAALEIPISRPSATLPVAIAFAALLGGRHRRRSLQVARSQCASALTARRELPTTSLFFI